VTTNGTIKLSTKARALCRTHTNNKNYFTTKLLQQNFENRSTIYSYFDFGLKNSSFRLPYQRPSSSADCARELFNGSNGSANLVDSTWKNFLVGGCGFFVTDVMSEVVLGSFWLMLTGLGPNRYAKVFRWSFHWKLGSSPSLLSLRSTF